jgi:hypothetical protein
MNGTLVRAKFAVLVLLLSVTTVFGQTVSEIESRFGQPVPVYSLTEHIWTTPGYTSDGQVCQMKLFPKRVESNTDYLSNQLPFEELKFILNRLIPPAARGIKGESFGLTETGGGIAWTTYPYENAIFIFTFRLRLSKEPLKHSESYSFSADEIISSRKPAKTPPSYDDFDNSQTANLEIVTIKWAGRKCADR